MVNVTDGTGTFFKDDGMELSIFPNPTSSDVNVSTGEEMQTLEILSILGETVYRKEIHGAFKTTLNGLSLEKGIYFITVITVGGSEMTGKLLVE